MTADFVQNVEPAGNNVSFPSQARAVYNQDMSLASLALNGTKRDLNTAGRGRAFPPEAAYAEIVQTKDAIQKREGDLYRGRSPSEIKSKDGEMEDMKLMASDLDFMRGDYSEKHNNLPLPAKLTNPQLENFAEGGEKQEKLADRKAKCTNEREVRTSVGLKPQVATVVPQAAPIQHSQPQCPQQATSGGWEKFLPHKSLRILLVEDDDSTRHVIGALLRNCGYEVTTAASGVQAWELMQDMDNYFDLALTEVMLPSLSGLSLLSKIMNQESCKRLPVVMMSGLDSVDVVFKCLSKGAVDFLVKPVRKNELRNLWQHVWRKCHSSSGSGSGSGSQTGKVANLKNINGSGNNSDGESSSLNIGGGSDNGSGTQSFWTKKKVEVKSPGPLWESTQHPHVASAHADIQAKDDALPKDCRRPCLDAIRGSSAMQAKLPDHLTNQNAEISTPRTSALENQVGSSGHMQDFNENVHKVLPMEDVERHHHLDRDEVDDRVVGASTSGTKVIDLLGNIAFQFKSKEKLSSSEEGNMLDRGASNSPNTRDNISGSISLPTLELTLKRSQTAGDVEGKVQDKHVLRQSGTSAFSRYTSGGTVLHQQSHYPAGSYASTPFPLQGGYVRDTTTGIISTGKDKIRVMQPTSAADRASLRKGPELSAPFATNQVNSKDMAPSLVASSGQDVLAQPAEDDGASASAMLNVIAVPSPAMLSSKGASAYGLLRNHTFCTHSSKSSREGTDLLGAEGFSQQAFEDHGRAPQSHQQIYHRHSHHYHHHVQHHYHHIHSIAKPGPSESPDGEQTVTNQLTDGPQCGSSNMMSHVTGNLGQSGSSNGYGTNGNSSVSGSNHASNTHYGTSNVQSCARAAAGGNGDNGNNTGNCGSGNGHGISSVNGGNSNGLVIEPEQNTFTRREAALNKFRQKRKERCFEKKVRYQSRKRLAEQRPRIRGQFVRQSIFVSPNSEKENDVDDDDMLDGDS